MRLLKKLGWWQELGKRGVERWGEMGRQRLAGLTWRRFLVDIEDGDLEGSEY